ncbi:MAG: GAF domain-containing sensor histidine kinase, partial [Candidatus Methanoperedens sp.]
MCPETQNIDQIFEFRNTLMQLKTIEEVISNALDFAFKKIQAQTVSLFLFSKDGILERVGIVGKDKDGLPIDDNWFSDERHEAGVSFTGKVVDFESCSKYGIPKLSNDLNKDEIHVESGIAYLNKLGILQNAVAVPLSGSHRTYGVFELINKMGKDGQVVSFNPENLLWVSIVAISTATAISNLKRRYEFEMLADFSRMLLESFSSNYVVSNTYASIAKSLVNRFTPYKATIIRVATQNGLELVARDGCGIHWDNRDDSIIYKGDRLAWQVYFSGEPVIINRIQEREKDFKNISWIYDNNLKGYACFPLKVDNTVLGTISLYTGFIFKLSGDNSTFVNNLVYLLATFIQCNHLLEELQEAREERDTETEKIISEARSVGFDRSIQEIYHQHKHELQELQGVLKEAASGGYRKMERILREQIEVINNRINNIYKGLIKIEHVSVNINTLIKDVTRYFSLETEKKGIRFNINCQAQIPDIYANRADMRDIIYNLVSNAIKAIAHSGKGKGLGQIDITTSIVEVKDIEFIQVAIGDNGAGIKREEWDKVYDRGFSTYPGGTGVGLFVAKNTVKDYGGQISLDSTIGKGTVFYVRIPWKRHA